MIEIGRVSGYNNTKIAGSGEIHRSIEQQSIGFTIY
jgi:hypothetical protein